MNASQSMYNNGSANGASHAQQQTHQNKPKPLAQSNYAPVAPQSCPLVVKQTQASLARSTRIHQLQQANLSSQQQQVGKDQQQSAANTSQQQQPTGNNNKSTTFVDCLIRRFKDCFSQDFCTVPMFVVGNLSPGSDGNHLILPPCVSLDGQSINRFSSAKNLRPLSSIRESCRTIEQLDLSGNKLNDLIEVYKILQYTPNLRFLNLSENDLSRSSPVAVAASSCNAAHLGSSSSPHWLSGSSMTLAGSNHRTFLGPINQNHQSNIGARRHSTLGQTPTLTTRPNSAANSTVDRRTNAMGGGRLTSNSRINEARQLTAAVAQSKKTSSSLASKLANSATVSGSTRQSCSTGSRTVNDRLGQTGKVTRGSSSATASTIQLARSLSSLSAKDVRAASSSLTSRLSARRNAEIGGSRNLTAASTVSLTNRTAVSQSPATGPSSSLSTTDRRRLEQQHTQRKELTSTMTSISDTTKQQVANKTGKVTQIARVDESKLYVEPIAESEDMDLSELIPPNTLATTPSPGANSNNQPATQTAATTGSQPKALASPSQQTGSQMTTKHHHHHQSTTIQSFGSSSSSSMTINAVHHHHHNNQNFRRTFESINALALNNTGCPWRVVCSILSRMPNLEELHLSLNNYERIDLDLNEFKHHQLKRLYLCNNPKLTNWEELDKLLIAFPSLEALSIADCNISQIPENFLDKARGWKKLCGLNINGWPIKEWPIVERLNQLPSLVDLKCRNLDVFNTIDEPRQHLIARLPRLQRLNGSEIEEREQAEKAFLRFFMANSHLERPPRFYELVQVHGEVTPVECVLVDLSPPSQACVRVVYLNRNHYCKENDGDILMSEDFLTKLMDNVEPNNVVHASTICGDDNMATGEDDSLPVADDDTIVSKATTSTGLNSVDNFNDGSESKLTRLFKDEGQEVVAMEVDLRQSVRKFKTTLASVFGLGSQNLILYYIDHEMVGLMGPELIKHNQKKLWNYNVQDGDQFIVEEQ